MPTLSLPTEQEILPKIYNQKFYNALNRIEQNVPPIWLMRQAGRYHSHYQNLKTKYSGLDLGDVAIDDIPDLLRQGALDLDNLCKKIPNFEKDGAGFLLKGTPITTPKKSAIADLLGIQIPEVKDFVYGEMFWKN